MPSSAFGAMTARKEALRYLAETEPENFRQQLSLEQVPMKGLHKDENRLDSKQAAFLSSRKICMQAI